MNSKLKTILTDIKLNHNRLTDRQLKHMAEHIDNSMTELAFAANILVKILEHQSQAKRKDEQENPS